MDASGVIAIIFIIVIGLGIITVILLAVFGVFEEKKKKKIIQGPFSIERGLKSSTKRYMVASRTDQLVFSNTTTIKCSDYTWTYGTFSNSSITIPKALITSKNKIVSASSAQDGATITVITPTSSTDTTLTSWNLTDLDSWCLASNNKLCLFEENDIVSLKSAAANAGFLFTPVEAVTSSSICAS